MTFELHTCQFLFCNMYQMLCQFSCHTVCILCIAADHIHCLKQWSVDTAEIIESTFVQVLSEILHRVITLLDQLLKSSFCCIHILIILFLRYFTDLTLLFFQCFLHGNLFSAEHADDLIPVFRNLDLLMAARAYSFFKHRFYSSQLW